MNTGIRLGVYWIFQVVNTLTSLGLLLAPKRFHESMFEDHQAAYALLGFSETALEMLHNVLRGQGAALLAISVMIFMMQWNDRRAYALIALTCGFSLIAHGFTLHQHVNSEIVRLAISSLKPLYGMIVLNGLLAIGAIWTYLRSPYAKN